MTKADPVTNNENYHTYLERVTGKTEQKNIFTLGKRSVYQLMNDIRLTERTDKGKQYCIIYFFR